MKRAIFVVSMFGMGIATNANAQESFPEVKFSGLGDARVSYSSGEPGWLDGGYGKTRYGSDPNGNDEVRLNLSELSLMMNTQFNWELSTFVHAKFDPEQKNDIDLVEAYAKYSNLFENGIRTEARLGIFYPHMSMENIDIAWTSPYSITSSAINSWIGEEIKTTGLEIFIEKEFEESALSFTGTVFGLNDPAGTLLAFRGWALQDSKTTLFGEFPLPPVHSIGPDGKLALQDPYVVPHLEVDDRVGYVVGFDWESFGLFSINSQFYNNRGDREAVIGGQYGWETEFINIGVSLDMFEDFEIFGQYMKGNTKMGGLVHGEIAVDVDYDSFYILASKTYDIHRFTVRYDHFAADDNTLVGYDNNKETGHAWLFAYSADLFENQKLMLEYLHVDSDRANRAEHSPITRVKENQVQASYRVRF
ncbi:hypothetical protein [Pseudemcibacter aquimaris]|uniref:hypothetical protein n=1 Tax=Pseudemcibacter aquimaris TaxID=2857064 RepID=UPI002011FF3C|nr:hypothetical protein [Pseudemcibacter aquimaris]MCC3861080.1 hypothetical protein [Pseudemcibacter aquimaris]WDU59898.1 hypothetical protein KW060_06470 [Pseudemcibacter aquimaris]